jgi:hypothetical protein
VGREAQYFHARDWTTQISLIRLRKSSFPRKDFERDIALSIGGR